MSPTVFRYKKYRFLFYSREEQRMHIHVWCPDGEAKIWIEPEIELAVQKGLKDREIKELLEVTEERIDEIRQSWQDHFRG
jgi:hypothetical protein